MDRVVPAWELMLAQVSVKGLASGMALVLRLGAGDLHRFRGREWEDRQFFLDQDRDRGKDMDTGTDKGRNWNARMPDLLQLERLADRYQRRRLPPE